MDREKFGSMLKLYTGTLDGSLKSMFARQVCVLLGDPESGTLTDEQISKLAARSGEELLRWINGARLEELPALALMGVLDGLHEAEETMDEANRILARASADVWMISPEGAPLFSPTIFEL